MPTLVEQMVLDESERLLNGYRENSNLLREHTRMESARGAGGYAGRQLYELIQNAADEMPADDANGKPHKITFCIHTENSGTADERTLLYCANTGRPFTPEGARNLMYFISDKRGNQIGRFGIGFKALAGLTDEVLIASKTGPEETSYLLFDREHNRRCFDDASLLVRGERPPLFRLGVVGADMAEGDSKLTGLLREHTTVIRIRLDEGPDSAQEQLDELKLEFLLFCPHVGELWKVYPGLLKHYRVTKDTTGWLELFQERAGERLNPRTYTVLEGTFRPSDKAVKEQEAMLNDRRELPFSLAIGRGRQDNGAYWAFLPTETSSSLSALINAPWALTDDRTHLRQHGAYNNELLEAVAELVVSQAPTLLTRLGIGGFLDFLPSPEVSGWPDETLAKILYAKLADACCFSSMNSDASGKRKLFSRQEARFCPFGDTIPNLKGAMSLWKAVPWLEEWWIDPDAVSSSTRRARLRGLGVKLPQEGSLLLVDWLESVSRPKWRSEAQHEPVERSVKALEIAALMAGLEGTGKANIVLCGDGKFRSVSDNLYLPYQDAQYEGGELERVVDRAVAVSAKDHLEKLKIRPLDQRARFEDFLRSAPKYPGGDFWTEFWNLARSVDPREAVDIVKRNRFVPLVKTAGGHWLDHRRAIRTGDVVKDAATEPWACVDPDFRQNYEILMVHLGVIDRPVKNWISPDQFRAKLQNTEQAARKQMGHDLGYRNCPGVGAVTYEGAAVPGPLFEYAPYLKNAESMARYHTALLTLSAEQECTWTMTANKRGVSTPILAPHLQHICQRQGDSWLLDQHDRPIKKQVLLSPSAGELERKFFSVAKDCTPAQAQALGLPASPSQVDEAFRTEFWSAALTRFRDSEYSEELSEFYVLAAKAECPRPSHEIPARGTYGTVYALVHDVYVEWEEGTFQELTQTRGVRAAILVASKPDARVLRERWGMLVDKAEERLGRDGIQAIPTDAPVEKLLDRFPFLKGVTFGSDAHKHADLVPCSELIDAEGNEFDLTLDEAEGAEVRLLFRATLDDKELLDRIKVQFNLDQNIEIPAPQKMDGRLAERLLKMLGGNTSPLRGLLAGFCGADDDPAKVADRFLNVYGYESLKRLTDAFRQRGLNPPERWGGTSSARRWVEAYGFPAEYAGFSESTVPDFVDVEPPVVLGELHDFQKPLVQAVADLLRGGREKQRAILCLPTGSGKTRIAVQGAATAMLEPDEAGRQLRGVLLWVAQTEELCEQAVIQWKQIWRSLESHVALRINRFWQGRDAEPVDTTDRIQVVVAIDAQLRTRVLKDDTRYDWIRKANAVVLDEAHHAVADTYRELLKQVGLTGDTKDRVPLLGLTATPFRANKQDTVHLQRVFHNCHLTEGLEQALKASGGLFVHLRNEGFLAEEVYEELQGQELELTKKELDKVKSLPTLPTSAEARLGENEMRNKDIVAKVVELARSSEWGGDKRNAPSKILVFAPSVRSAERIAGLLTLKGISARAMSGDTDKGLRRHYVTQFNNPDGGLQVLVNYNVLAAGFDAPKVRVVVVARPVFSRPTYLQMVGRGLRGERNGGTQRCLVVTVRDNIVNYPGGAAPMILGRYGQAWEEDGEASR